MACRQGRPQSIALRDRPELKEINYLSTLRLNGEQLLRDWDGEEGIRNSSRRRDDDNRKARQ